MKARTQDQLPIEDIRNDVVILKDGSFAVVLQTSAVNFDLLSEREQLAIIDSFAGLLNSLSFSIQIVIRSKRLDISSYLQKLQVAEQNQSNELLKTLISHYKNFIETTVRENEVLDKQFYIAILVSYYELGLVKDNAKNLQKALTVLVPRRDHIIRQLGRIGLKATQLNTEKLIRLYYDIFNESYSDSNNVVTTQAINQLTPQATNLPANTKVEEKPAVEAPQAPQPQVAAPPPPLSQTQAAPQVAPVAQVTSQPIQPAAPVATDGGGTPASNMQSKPSNHAPFVTEELPDEYGTA